MSWRLRRTCFPDAKLGSFRSARHRLRSTADPAVVVRRELLLQAVEARALRRTVGSPACRAEVPSVSDCNDKSRDRRD